MVTLEVIEIVARSISISGGATLLALLWCIPLVMRLVMDDSRISRALLDFFNSMTAIPTVVLGLFLYLLLSRSGPLGFTGLLYTPTAITIGQAILISPYIISLTVSSLYERKKDIWELALSLGATKWQAAYTLLKEGFSHLLLIILIAFNRALGELGIALMLGGNIKGVTRVMTTAIALEVSRGEFELAITLGGIFLMLTLIISIVLRQIGQRI